MKFYKLQLSELGQVFISAESYLISEARELAQRIANKRNKLVVITGPGEHEIIYPITS